MRILLVNPNTSPSSTAAMLEIARQTAPPDMSLDGATAVFGSPLITDETALATAADAVLALLCRRAEAFDGVIVSAFGDPGLDRARAVLGCPVTGIAEAGMAEAAAGGRRFAVVTTTPALVGSISRSAAQYGHAALFGGVFLTPGEPHAVMADPQGLEEALMQACLEAVGAGAEAVVIGGGPLAIAARATATRLAVPLIEPIPAAVRLAVRRARLPG